MNKLILLVLSSISLTYAMEQEKYVNIILNKVYNKTNQAVGVNIRKYESQTYMWTAASPITIIKSNKASMLTYSLKKQMPTPTDYAYESTPVIVFQPQDNKYELSLRLMLSQGNLSVPMTLQQVKFNKNGKPVKEVVGSFPTQYLTFNPNENVNIYIDVILKGEDLADSDIDLYATEGTPQPL